MSVCVCVHVRARVCVFTSGAFSRNGVSVPLSPAKSRIVEAVCILLCQKYPEAHMSSGAGKAINLKCLS